MKVDNALMREWANCVGYRKSRQTVVPTPFNLNTSWDDDPVMIQPGHGLTQ